MNFHCPTGCGALSVFIARRGRRQRPYVGCRACGVADWAGGNTATDVCCADAMPGEDPPFIPDVIDRVIGDDGHG